MLFSLFLFLCFYLPFQIALNPTSGIDLASVRIFIIGIFFVWLIYLLKRKTEFKPDNQERLILFFFLLSLISLFFAKNYIWGIRKLAYLFSIFPIYFIAKNLLKDKEKIIKTIKVLVFSGTVVSILGILQFILQFFWSDKSISGAYLNFIGPIFWGRNLAQMVAEYPSWFVGISGQNYFRSIATFPDPHSFSLFLGMMLPLPIILFFISKKKILWSFSFLFILTANILTFSRGGYLAATAGIITFLTIFWNKIERKHKLMASLLAIFFLLMMTVPSPVSERFVSSFNLEEGSNAGRIEMWEKSLEIIKENPFFGAGIGNFSLAVDKSAGYRNPIYAHSTYLDIASEMGILASLVWILILFITLKKFWFFSKENMIYAGFFTSLIIFSAHSLVENGIYSPVVLPLFLIIIGFGYQHEK